jgi:hypothetical protein
VFFRVDVRALPVFGRLDAGLLHRPDMAVRAGAGFFGGDVRLAALELRHFGVLELTGLHALFDARLLIHVALHVGLHPLRRCGIRIADLRVVLLTVDVGADRVLRFREARLLGRRHRAVLERILLHRFHSLFLVLELRGLVCGQLAALQAPLDALLLVDVAPDGRGSVLGERSGRKERADD